MAAAGGSGLPPWEYYQTYYGHTPKNLERMLAALRSTEEGSGRVQPVVFLAGDSTLDNKHWLFLGGSKTEPGNYSDDRWSAEAIGNYRKVLDPPRMVQDVAFWLTTMGAGSSGPSFCALNTAVEESTVNGRSKNLTVQDMFIRDNITSNDILVISAGGNDVALHPTALTQAAVMKLMSGQQEEAMAYFRGLFKDEMEAFAASLVAKAKPRAVIVCMLYYLDESPDQRGFADTTLRNLGYNDNPAFLQGIIRAVYEAAVTQISLEGTKVIPLPLFEVLDGKDTRDYLARVEPSVAGGEKMARALARRISEVLGAEWRDGSDRAGGFGANQEVPIQEKRGFCEVA
eukprot:CAMPEP_0175630398 /NCGR_PEP_ID=MMETSP0096-20121207/72989_1 /TAXON_ID=311494 /ORGANISM="Alexandrium monilatum, Strain CCMP3105" /LENGTH=342 /DNA_ID=CAMNT_0016935815 /DNA_START=22 /DNA_END=1053 /DNA_ORIENTATION=-